MNIIRVKPTCEYPCQWDDLINSHNKVIATIYTIEEAEKDNLKLGITKGKDGIYTTIHQLLVFYARFLKCITVRH